VDELASALLEVERGQCDAPSLGDDGGAPAALGASTASLEEPPAETTLPAPGQPADSPPAVSAEAAPAEAAQPAAVSEASASPAQPPPASSKAGPPKAAQPKTVQFKIRKQGTAAVTVAPETEAPAPVAPAPTPSPPAPARAPRWRFRIPIPSIPVTLGWKRAYRVVDAGLELVNAPLARLKPGARNLIGWLALATIGVSLLSAFLLPLLMPRRDAITFLEERLAAMEARKHAPPAEGEGAGHGAPAAGAPAAKPPEHH
jgi:hypothetical protein